jgi:hypothetical protein
VLGRRWFVYSAVSLSQYPHHLIDQLYSHIHSVFIFMFSVLDKIVDDSTSNDYSAFELYLYKNNLDAAVKVCFYTAFTQQIGYLILLIKSNQ